MAAPEQEFKPSIGGYFDQWHQLPDPAAKRAAAAGIVARIDSSSSLRSWAKQKEHPWLMALRTYLADE